MISLWVSSSGIKFGQVPEYLTDVTVYVGFSDGSQVRLDNATWHPEDGSMMIHDVSVVGTPGARYIGCYVSFTFWGKSRMMVLDDKGHNNIFGANDTLTLTNLCVKFV